ncbi:MAG: DUF4136 domain-containing protein [Planctomycetota bacterium]
MAPVMLAKLLALCVCTALLGGCARCCESYQVRVNSVTSDAAMAAKDYALVPGAEGVHGHDLKFREYSEYVHRGLQRKGFNQVEYESAGIIVVVGYGVREPTTHYYIETHPAVSKASWSRPYYGGYEEWQTRFDSYKTYTRYLIIGGYEAERFRQSAERFRQSEGEDLIQLWKTTVETTGLSCNLRRVMPVLAAAACEHVGRDTGGKVDITVGKEDRKVKSIRGQE